MRGSSTDPGFEKLVHQNTEKTQINKDWEDKAWGRVRHIENAAVSLLEVKEGTRTSRHSHNSRWNAFYPVTALVVVELFVHRDSVEEHLPSGILYHIAEYTPGEASILCLLECGDKLAVPPNVEHRFRVLKSGQLIEVYWTEDGSPVRLDDIVRVDQGGEDDLYQLRRELGLAD